MTADAGQRRFQPTWKKSSYGKPAAQSVAELVKRHGAERVFLMVSGTLNRADRRGRQAAPRAAATTASAPSTGCPPHYAAHRP